MAILMALAFLMLSLPVVTSALGLAGNLTVDSTVKTDILRRQYCGLGVREYVRYLTLDPVRWSEWWTANQDPDLSLGEAAEQTVTICGESVTLRATHPAPSDQFLSEPPESLGLIPPLSAYNNRRLQSSVSAGSATAAPGGSVTYTVRVQNRGSGPTNQVTKVHDLLPQGFCYQAGSSSGQITVGSTTTQISVADPDIDYLNGPAQCSDPSVTQKLVWDMPNQSLASGDFITLAFAAVASSQDGAYCNEVWAEPGSLNTRSGQTAIVQVGSSNGLCPGQATKLTKSVTSASGLTLATSSDPMAPTYVFTVGYAIVIENIGTQTLTVDRVRDLLPPGFTYNLGSSTGGISFNPDEHLDTESNRWRLTWDLNPALVIPSQLTGPTGATATLLFNATATVARGDHWNDVLVTLGECSADDNDDDSDDDGDDDGDDDSDDGDGDDECGDSEGDSEDQDDWDDEDSDDDQVGEDDDDDGSDDEDGDDGDDGDEPIYSWPTAVVTIRETFDVEATGPDGEITYISIQVVVGNESGAIARWDIR